MEIILGIPWQDAAFYVIMLLLSFALLAVIELQKAR